MSAKDAKTTVIKEPPARAEQAAAVRYSLAHEESVSVRWPRSLRPLWMLGLLVGVVVAVAGVMQVCNGAFVRAAGVMYPAGARALRVPLARLDRKAHLVGEVYKREGEAVQAGEKLLRMDAVAEELQLEQVQRRVQACVQRLQDFDLQPKESLPLRSGVSPEAQRKFLESDVERARLEERRVNRAMEDKTLRAPVGGVLRGFKVQGGDWVYARDTVGWICDTSQLLFSAQVLQRDLPRVQVGQRARVYVNASAGGNGAYEAEVAGIGEFLEAVGDEYSDPLGLFAPPPPRSVIQRHAVVRLKVLGAVGGAPAEAATASAESAPRPGCAGQARILVGGGKLAEWLFRFRPWSPAPPVYYVVMSKKGKDLSSELPKSKRKTGATRPALILPQKEQQP